MLLSVCVSALISTLEVRTYLLFFFKKQLNGLYILQVVLKRVVSVDDPWCLSCSPSVLFPDLGTHVIPLVMARDVTSPMIGSWRASTPPVTRYTRVTHVTHVPKGRRREERKRDPEMTNWPISTEQKKKQKIRRWRKNCTPPGQNRDNKSENDQETWGQWTINASFSFMPHSHLLTGFQKRYTFN